MPKHNWTEADFDAARRNPAFQARLSPPAHAPSPPGARDALGLMLMIHMMLMIHVMINGR